MPLSRAARLASLTLCLWAAPPQADAAFELPPIDRIVQYQPRLPLQVVTADGVEIAQFGAERRIYVPLSRIPKRLHASASSPLDMMLSVKRPGGEG